MESHYCLCNEGIQHIKREGNNMNYKEADTYTQKETVEILETL